MDEQFWFQVFVVTLFLIAFLFFLFLRHKHLEDKKSSHKNLEASDYARDVAQKPYYKELS